MKLIATLAFALGIAGLFLLERIRKAPTSKALLLPLAWMLLSSSRNVSAWFSIGVVSDAGANYLEGNPIDRNVYALLLVAGIGILLQRRRKVAALLRINPCLFLFFGYCLVSLAWSDFPLVGFKRWIQAIGDVVMILIVLSEGDWLLAWRRLYAWAAFLLLPISLLFILYFPDLGLAAGIYDLEPSWTGVTTTKNELGMICMVFGIASLASLLSACQEFTGTARIRQIIAHSLVLAMSIGMLYKANSATSLACLLIGSTLLLATSWPPFMRRPVLVHWLAASLIGLSVSSLFLGMGTGLVNGLGRKSDLTGRTEMWAYALHEATNPVLGAGYESFWLGDRLERILKVAPGVNQAHNGYLEIYLNLGWAGILVLTVLLVVGYRSIIAAFRRNPAQARLGFAYFVVALSYNFTEGAFKFRHPVWISLLLAIMTAPLVSARREADPAAPAPPTHSFLRGWWVRRDSATPARISQ